MHFLVLTVHKEANTGLETFYKTVLLAQTHSANIPGHCGLSGYTVQPLSAGWMVREMLVAPKLIMVSINMRANGAPLHTMSLKITPFHHRGNKHRLAGWQRSAVTFRHSVGTDRFVYSLHTCVFVGVSCMRAHTDLKSVCESLKQTLTWLGQAVLTEGLVCFCVK